MARLRGLGSWGAAWASPSCPPLPSSESVHRGPPVCGWGWADGDRLSAEAAQRWSCVLTGRSQGTQATEREDSARWRPPGAVLVSLVSLAGSPWAAGFLASRHQTRKSGQAPCTSGEPKLRGRHLPTPASPDPWFSKQCYDQGVYIPG